jgi:DNA-binding CsgD family transcriptional regulator
MLVWLDCEDMLRASLAALANRLSAWPGEGRSSMPSEDIWRRRTTSRSYSIELTAPRVDERPARTDSLRDLVTGEPAFVVAATGRVVGWNETLARLTGVAPEAVLGGSCQSALTAISHREPPLTCHRTCPLALPVRGGPPAQRVPIIVDTVAGPRPSELVTISGRGSELMHLIEEVHRPAVAPVELPHGGSGTLTPRQLEVLHMLNDGITCNAIASCLSISHATARNHIRAILRELRVHSQLEAVAEGRRRHLV